MKKVVAIVQARMSSSRLPNKVLKPLAEKPVLTHVFSQLSFSKKINETILATSTDKSDDLLKKWAIDNDKNIFRGDLDNVLKRFYDTAIYSKADIIVRITADCPLIDPSIVDTVINKFFEGDYDYYTNANPPTFPDGLDTEVFTFNALEVAYENAKLKSEIEHVTPFIRNHTDLFKIGNYTSNENLGHYRWTLDNPEDFEFLKIIFNNLYKEKSFIGYESVLDFIKANKSILEINSKINRNEGFVKSLKEDKKTI